MSEKKKITAAAAAVMRYLEEEAAAAIQAAPPEMIAAPAGGTAPGAPVSFWGVSGRQAQMQLRTMMQLKAFHRLR